MPLYSMTSRHTPNSTPNPMSTVLLLCKIPGHNHTLADMHNASSRTTKCRHAHTSAQPDRHTHSSRARGNPRRQLQLLCDLAHADSCLSHRHHRSVHWPPLLTGGVRGHTTFMQHAAPAGPLAACIAASCIKKQTQIWRRQPTIAVRAAPSSLSTASITCAQRQVPQHHSIT
jgi:hypothetical protein